MFRIMCEIKVRPELKAEWILDLYGQKSQIQMNDSVALYLLDV